MYLFRFASFSSFDKVDIHLIVYSFPPFWYSNQYFIMHPPSRPKGPRGIVVWQRDVYTNRYKLKQSLKRRYFQYFRNLNPKKSLKYHPNWPYVTDRTDRPGHIYPGFEFQELNKIWAVGAWTGTPSSLRSKLVLAIANLIKEINVLFFHELHTWDEEM